MSRAATLDVTCVVVAHDSGEDLLRCARSVLAQPLALELVVVDNASRDGALARLPADPRVRLLLNPDNRGFARACNQGAELARGGTLLFLNPDCVLPDGALATLLSTVHADATLGALGVQLLDSDGRPQAASHRDDPLPGRALHQALRLAAAPPPATSVASDPLQPALLRVDAISGALMLVPRAAFDAVDGFDAGYVLHCEDLDLCRRLRQAGYRVATRMDVHVTHAKGTSSRRRPFWVEWQKHRGMWRYFRKFDAARTAAPLRLALWLGLWAHYVPAAASGWWRARQRRPDARGPARRAD